MLIASTLLHDIAKIDLLVRHSSGNTLCPGHEIIGALQVKEFSSRFGLDKKGTDRVTKIVNYHGDVNNFLTLVMYKKNAKKYLSLFTEIVGDINIDLLLFMYADIMGSDLKKSIPDEYIKREKAITTSLKYILK